MFRGGSDALSIPIRCSLIIIFQGAQQPQMLVPWIYCLPHGKRYTWRHHGTLAYSNQEMMFIEYYVIFPIQMASETVLETAGCNTKDVQIHTATYNSQLHIISVGCWPAKQYYNTTAYFTDSIMSCSAHRVSVVISRSEKLESSTLTVVRPEQEVAIGQRSRYMYIAQYHLHWSGPLPLKHTLKTCNYLSLRSVC